MSECLYCGRFGPHHCGPPCHDRADAQLDAEMGRTSWEHSCRHLLDLERCCRRQAGHVGQCATGFGTARVRWNSEQLG